MRVRARYLLFYLSFGLVYAGVLFEKTAISFASGLKTVCYILAIAAIIAKFFYERRVKYTEAKKTKEWIVLLVLAVVLLLIIKAKDIYLLLVFLLGFMARDFEDIKMNNIIKISFCMCGIFLICIPLLSVLHIIPNLNTMRGIGESSRYTYGFNHSQVFPMIFAYMIFMIYANGKKVHLRDFVIVQIVTFLIYYCFDSRNALLTTELFYLVHFFFSFIRKFKNNGLIYKIGRLFIYMSSACSFVLLVLFMKGNQLAIDIDYVLSHRFREPAWYFVNGYRDYFKFRSYNEYYALQQAVNKGVDNTFFYIVIRYGIPALLFFCLFYNSLFRFCKRQKNILMCEVLSVVAISIILTNSVTSYFLPFMVIASREVWQIVHGHTVGKLNVYMRESSRRETLT